MLDGPTAASVGLSLLRAVILSLLEIISNTRFQHRVGAKFCTPLNADCTPINTHTVAHHTVNTVDATFRSYGKTYMGMKTTFTGSSFLTCLLVEV